MLNDMAANGPIMFSLVHCQVRHTFADAIEDHQLVGARFTDDKGRSLAVAAYDSSEIFVFQRS